jgi:glycosyltransferase involved in cell wall biosynthesis
MPSAPAFHPELVATYQGYNVVRYRESFFGVPELAGPVDLNLEEECRHAGVIRAESRDAVQERITTVRDVEAVPVEFAGWVPIFEHAGNCGRHPQFKHTASPPAGYRFTCSAPLRNRTPSLWDTRLAPLCRRLGHVLKKLPWLMRPLFGVFRGTPGVERRDRLRVFVSMVRLFFTLRRGGARLGPVLRFLRSRHYQSQLMLGKRRGLVFLPSMPHTFGQNPWVVEIEDPTTLFFPFIQNGGTRRLRIKESPYFPIIRTLLESDHCKGIVTHMKSTAQMVSKLFGSDTIRSKVFYAPLGVRLPDRWQHHEESEQINLLFTNSWHQMTGNFFLRGGLDVLEAFAILRERYPQLRLTLRTHLPGLDVRHHRIIEKGWVRVIDRFSSAREIEALLAESHIFLLPAARVHIVSLLQAMAHGLAVVTSDGWGFEEYVNHGRNGLVVKGRYGKVSWVDEKVGMLRENYTPMYQSDPKVVRGLVKAVSFLVENRSLRKRLGRTARRDVETTYNLERWNCGLKQAFDKAREHRISEPGVLATGVQDSGALT